MKKEETVNLQCSFCGKSQREVKKLIAGPRVYICDECIGLCNDIIAEEVERESSSPLVQPAGDPGPPPTLFATGVAAVDEAVAALRKVEERLADNPGLVSPAVTLLETSAELLRAGQKEWDERTRSSAAEVSRRRELERQEEEAVRVWGLAREDRERARATVSEVEVSVGRLRGALYETLGGEHRLLLDEVGLKVERLRGSLGPDRGGMEGLPLPPLDGRASALALLAPPHFWRVTRALRKVIRDGKRVLGYHDLEALEGVVGEVTGLGEQLGLELRGGVTRWRASEIRARLEEMQKTVTAVQQHMPGSFTPPPVLRALEETVDELCSLSARLAALGPT